VLAGVAGAAQHDQVARVSRAWSIYASAIAVMHDKPHHTATPGTLAAVSRGHERSLSRTPPASLTVTAWHRLNVAHREIVPAMSPRSAP
jgi:hypothetical protein